MEQIHNKKNTRVVYSTVFPSFSIKNRLQAKKNDPNRRMLHIFTWVSCQNLPAQCSLISKAFLHSYYKKQPSDLVYLPYQLFFPSYLQYILPQEQQISTDFSKKWVCLFRSLSPQFINEFRACHLFPPRRVCHRNITSGPIRSELTHNWFTSSRGWRTGGSPAASCCRKRSSYGLSWEWCKMSRIT